MKKYKLIQNLSVGLILMSIAIANMQTHAGGGNNARQFYNGCAQYRLSSYGGEAGFRLMTNSGDFRSTNNGSVAGKVCASGRTTLEIAKRNPNTHATVELYGRHYEFKPGDRGNKQENGWFRRYYQIDLPQKTRYRGGYNHQGTRHAVVPVNTYNGHHNNGGQTQEYLYGHLDNSQQYYQPQRFHNKSRKHRRAHRHGISHQHHGHHFTFN